MSLRDGDESRDSSTLRRGIAALTALGSRRAFREGGLGVLQVANMIGCDKSQASRTLKALKSLGIIERVPGSRRYRLGWQLYGLGVLAGDQWILRESGPVLARMADAVEARSYLMTLKGSEVLTILSRTPASRFSPAIGRAGQTVPAYCTASGRALLWDRSDDDLRDLFRNETFEIRASNTPRDVNELIARIRQDRSRGYAIAIDEYKPDLLTLAVPVRDRDGCLAVALGVSGPKQELGARMAEALREVMQAALRLEDMSARTE